jgi:hypothetical protein
MEQWTDAIAELECSKYRRFQRNAHIAVPDAKKASVWGKGTSVNGQAL